MMSSNLSQSSRRVLLVEDEFLLADDLAAAFVAAGFVVVGPAYTVAEATRLIESCGDLDGAVLDINLRGESVFPVVDALVSRGIPIVFTSGYDRRMHDSRYKDAVRFEKPFDPIKVVTALLQSGPGGR
jgi:DNA-binding response OmpR family regulator